MKNRTWRAPRPRRHATVIGAAVAGLVLAVGMNGQAFADDDEDREGASTRSAGSSCSAAELAELKAAGDNFAQACLPGNDFAGLKAQPDTLKPGESDSSDNLSLIANLPKQGPFASEAALNSDLAFKGNYVFAGNYEGFMVYDVKRPKYPRIVAQVKCTGAQNDISVYKNLLVLSVDSSRNDSSCASTAQSASVKTSWEGVRVFDISNPAAPRYVSAVETPCGSHTHTLAPDKKNQNVYVYVSSYSPNALFPDCQPPHDKIGVVKVPVDDPAAAKLVGTPVLFPQGGQPAGGYSSETTGCHDITAYPSKDIAAGACMGDGILMDISDRENPKVTTTVRDTENFAFWHSATFNNAGTKVVFTDELGGGGGPTCNPETGRTKGADAIYDITRLGQLKFGSYYKIPRTQSNTENCVAHNGSLIPVKGKDIMVQAWYQGGISVMDFTNSKKPKEIAWFDRGPISDTELKTGGSWSAYYYNGYIYSNDIQKGLDVLSLDDKRTDGAKKVRMDRFNPQSQPFYNN